MNRGTLKAKRSSLPLLSLQKNHLAEENKMGREKLFLMFDQGYTGLIWNYLNLITNKIKDNKSR